jgi:hypothetical protein
MKIVVVSFGTWYKMCLGPHTSGSDKFLPEVPVVMVACQLVAEQQLGLPQDTVLSRHARSKVAELCLTNIL